MAETEELAENDPGEPGDVVQLRDESENRKELREAQGAGAKNLDSSKQDEFFFGRLMWLKRRNFQNTIQVNQRGT